MKNKYNMGVVSVSFRKQAPEEIIKAAKEAGLSCIEWGSDVHAPCDNTERLLEIVGLQKKYDIVCSSYGTYFRLGETPLGKLDGYIKAAEILGTDILRLWCGAKSGAEYSNEEREALFEECRQAEQIARTAGVTLCLECHKMTFTERLSDALELMESINSPYFRMYWQPFQWKSIDENLVYAEKIAPFVRCIHVFNWKERDRFSLSLGIEEWREYLKRFPSKPTLLLEFMPDDNIFSLACEAEALRTIIGE